MALVLAKHLSERHPGLGLGSIRWDLFNARQNGLEESGALIRRGRRVLIDEDRYLAWMREQSFPANGRARHVA